MTGLLQTYGEFRPTAYDNAGAFLHGQRDWFVAPCGINRDSDALEKSNWEVQSEALEEADDTVETHRFGHWAVGWFEVCIIPPSSPAVVVAEELAESLADYPILDEERFSTLEWEEAEELWCDTFDDADRIHVLRKVGHDAETFAELMATARGLDTRVRDFPMILT